MIETTPFQLYKKVSHYVAQKKLEFVFSSTGASFISSSVPYHGFNYCWVDLEESDGTLQINSTYPYDSTCRGWIQEAWAHAKNQTRWTNIPTDNEFDCGFINKGPTVFMIYCRGPYQQKLQRAVELMNYMEAKVKWYRSKLINISGNYPSHIRTKGNGSLNRNIGSTYLLIGSRNWKYNFVLISVYLLLVKGMINHIGPGKNVDEAINNIKNTPYSEGMSRIFYHDLLYVLMKNFKYIVGDYNETILKNIADSTIHSIGFGEYSNYIELMCNGYFSNGENVKDIESADRVSTYVSYVSWFKPLVNRTIERLLEHHSAAKNQPIVRAA